MKRLFIAGLYFIFVLSVFAQQTVRVGFFAFDGYHVKDNDGCLSGYGYEYLQHLSLYADWTYEYIGYEKTWAEMLAMLENGEIDLLTSAQKTPEREKRFDFSDLPIGTSKTILTVKSGNSSYFTDDYEHYNGIRIGMISNNSRNDSFARFAKEYNFTYVPVFFEHISEMIGELKHGDKIDAIVTSNLRKIKNERIIAQFEDSPFYIMVRKGNTELLSKINQAVAHLTNDSPCLQLDLQTKYYQPQSSFEIPYTMEERRFIASCNASGKFFTATINPDRKPISWYDGTKYNGIAYDIASEIIKRTGLPVKMLPSSSRLEYQDKIKSGVVDIWLDARHDYSFAERKGFKITSPYLTCETSRVSLKKNTGRNFSVAVLRNADVTESTVKFLSSNMAVFYYDTVADCIDAVIKGNADCTYVYNYTAGQILYDDITNRLAVTFLSNFSTQFSIGIRSNEEFLLAVIFNKALASISDADINKIVNSYSKYPNHSFSLKSFIYNNPIFVVILILFVMFTILLISMLAFVLWRRHLENERSYEFERFISYVCRANDIVEEVDLVNKKRTSYRVKNNSIIKTEADFNHNNTLIDSIHPDDIEILSRWNRDGLQDIIDNQKEDYVECRIKQADGKYVWMAYMLLGLSKDVSHPNNFMVFCRNIDQVKKEESRRSEALRDAFIAAEQANKAKSSFMSRISHEIRTPLNAMLGYTAIAIASDDKEKIDDCLRKSETSARQLLGIINDVLDISSIESGKMKIAAQPFNFRKFVSNVTEMFYSQAQQKGIFFEVIIKNVIHENLIGDVMRLNQILLNLLSNAIKFTSKNGSVKLFITQLAVVNGFVHYRFEVTDTGCGMSKEFMKKIFTPFEQQDASIAWKYGGTGLGLSIIKNLAGMMDGLVSVESEEGKGTHFTVEMPIRLDEDASQNLPLAANCYSDLQVLFVDDEIDTCKYMQLILDRLGIRNDYTTCGNDAVDAVREKLSKNELYNMCFIDWKMPDMNGLETVRQIRKIVGNEMPIVIITAYDYSEIVQEAKAEGVYMIISKPIFSSSIEEVLNTIYGQPQLKKKEEQSVFDFSGNKILLVEDNEINREIATDILSSVGLLIDIAVNGQDAVRKFTESKPGTYQMILMDVQMPEMNGYEATKTIRNSTHEEAQSIPILAMTANAFAEDVTEALSFGMNGHIAKPIEPELLYKIIASYLSSV